MENNKTVSEVIESLDALYYRFYIKQNSKCFKCHSDNNLSLFHILHKDFLPLRYNPTNLVILCPTCQKIIKTQHNSISNWFFNNHRERYDLLIGLKLLDPTVSLLQLKTALEELKKLVSENSGI